MKKIPNQNTEGLILNLEKFTTFNSKGCKQITVSILSL